jgi:hypothetical protein
VKDCQHAVKRVIAGRQMDVTLECILALAEALDRRLDRIQAKVPLPSTPSIPPIPVSPEENAIYNDMQDEIPALTPLPIPISEDVEDEKIDQIKPPIPPTHPSIPKTLPHINEDDWKED